MIPNILKELSIFEFQGVAGHNFYKMMYILSLKILLAV